MIIGIKHKNWLCAGVTFVLFFTLYALTAQRGVSWQDSGEFQYRLLAGDYVWHSGIARAHPLYIFLGRGFVALFPVALRFYASALFSGFCMALALTVLCLLTVKVVGSRSAAVLASCTLGFAHMVWWMAAMTEVYALSLVFVFFELLLLWCFTQHRRVNWLLLLFAVNGLHFAVHNVALLALPVYAFLLVGHIIGDVRKRTAHLAMAAICWIVGSALIWWLALSELLEGRALGEVIASVLFGDGYKDHVLGMHNFNLRMFGFNMALTALSLTSPCWLLAPLGIFKRGVQDKTFRIALLTLTLIHGLFWIRYFVPDQATFVLPLLGLLAVWMGIGWQSLKGGVQSVKGATLLLSAGLCVNLTVLHVLPVWAEVRWGNDVRARNLPSRNEWQYWIRPWKQSESSADVFARVVESTLAEDEVLYADSTAAAPIMAWRQINGAEGRFTLVSPWHHFTMADCRRMIDEGRMYVVSPARNYIPDWLNREDVSFRQTGLVYKVEEKRGHGEARECESLGGVSRKDAKAQREEF